MLALNAVIIIGKGLLIAFGLLAGGLPKILKAARLAVLALWLAFNLNPVGVIVAAVGALIAIGALLIFKWGSVVAFFKGLVAKLKPVSDFFSGLGDKIKDVMAGVGGALKRFQSGVSGAAL